MTSILGPVVPDIIASFRVSVAAAGFLAFAFLLLNWWGSAAAFGIVLSVGFWARPLISNAAIDLKKTASQPAA